MYRKGNALIPSYITENCLLRELRELVGKEYAQYVFTLAGTLKTDIPRDVHGLLVAEAIDKGKTDLVAIIEQAIPV